jgi:hypothetical protein
MVGSGSRISKQNLLIAFIKKEVGSGIRCFFTPRIRIRDGAIIGSGSGIKHPGSATLGYIYNYKNFELFFIKFYLLNL